MPETSQHRERIRLDAIVFDAGTQVRAAINEDTVADYAAAMEAGVKFPPVVLFFDSTRYYMADGFHRGHAARRIGAEDIPAVVTVGTRTDALWYALGANKVNGARLTTADKRQAILLALKAWPEYSSTRIAEQVGCDFRYVSRIKDEARQDGTCPNLPDRVVGRDGKSYPATRQTAILAPISEDDQRLTRALADPLDASGPAITRRPLPRPSAPSNGMQFARIAVMKLEEIRDDDTERQQALDHVRRWLDAREA
jgi:hypothetical protein